MAAFIYRNSRIKPDDFVLRQIMELGKLLGIPRGAIARRKTSEAPVVGRSGSSLQRNAFRVG